MPSWIFKIKLLMAAGFLKNFLHGALETYVLHYHAKFCGDWSYCCRDITIFPVF